jgi:two-component system, NtrC family, sensor kinase
MSNLSSPSSHDLANTDPTYSLLAALAVPAWLHRPGQPLQGNSALQRLCGHDAPALAGIAHLQMVAESDRASLGQATEACLYGSGEPPAVQVMLLASGGGSRQVELTLRRLVNLPSGVTDPSVMVTCIDLSDFLHVQNMLQSMSGMLRQIIDGAPVASFVIDCNRRVTHWNAACERLTGCKAEDMLGRTEAWRAFYPEPQPLLAEMVVDGTDPALLRERYGDEARASPVLSGAYEKEAFFSHLGEAGLWLDFTAAPLRNAAGEVMGAIVTLQDVSERRRNAEELTRRLETMVAERSADLAAHARLMDAFIDNAPFGVAYTVNARVERANRRMAEIFGSRNGDPDSGQSPSARDFHMAPEDARTLIALAKPCFAKDQPLNHEMSMKHASGRPLWVQVNAYPVEYSDDTTGAWWMLQDRTEMRAAQEELRQRFDELQQTNQQAGPGAEPAAAAATRWPASASWPPAWRTRSTTRSASSAATCTRCASTSPTC